MQLKFMKGIRLECGLLSLLLFNLYAETIFIETLVENDGVTKINGVTNQEELQKMVNKTAYYSKAYRLTMDNTKTKVIMFAKKSESN